MRIKIITPDFDQERFVKRFAFFPFIHGEWPNQQIVWMEYYWQRQCSGSEHSWHNSGKYLMGQIFIEPEKIKK